LHKTAIDAVLTPDERRRQIFRGERKPLWPAVRKGFCAATVVSWSVQSPVVGEFLGSGNSGTLAEH
jgi:hypothetical protein